MDSVLVRISVRDPKNLGFDKFSRENKLAVADSILIKNVLNTRELVGNQLFTLEINPSNDQPEREHFNNVLFGNFHVIGDRTNPILDVAFDGVHILNGDLVSPKPEIVIQLRDENRWLALDDTAGLRISIVAPDSSVRNFYLDGSSPDAKFFPSTSGTSGKNNFAEVRLNPIFTEDGLYKLRVKGKDISGNSAGSIDYKIDFEIITKNSMSNLLNYPNPFSTRTCFAYTLTGETPPPYFRLQIMTVSGKIVREIDQNEFGELKIGRHISDFCWDGRDQFGDQLANGVYLYRFLAKKSDGSAFEKFENNSLDQFFNNGWGKMVLIR
jgi:hypothetical protein